MELTVSRFIDFCRTDWAPACERLARSLAVAIVATYAMGYAAGRILHRWNDRLASMASGRQPQAITPRPVSEPAWIAHWRANAQARKPAGSQAEINWRSANHGEHWHDSTAPIRQPQAAATVQTRPAAIQSPSLESLTVAQLRIMARAAGHKRLARSGRRAQLLEVLA